jgi:hypothetical protein
MEGAVTSATEVCQKISEFLNLDARVSKEFFQGLQNQKEVGSRKEGREDRMKGRGEPEEGGGEDGSERTGGRRIGGTGGLGRRVDKREDGRTGGQQDRREGGGKTGGLEDGRTGERGDRRAVGQERGRTDPKRKKI